MKRLALVLFLLLLSPTIHAATVDDATSLADRGNYTKAIEILRPLAASGDLGAQIYLGIYLVGGHKGQLNVGANLDCHEGKQWLTRALMLGQGLPQRVGASSIASMYMFGHCLPYNRVASYAYWSVAAGLGIDDMNWSDFKKGWTQYETTQGERLARQIWAKIDAAKNAASNKKPKANKEHGSAEKKTRGTGTGFIINYRGYVVTNSHVIDGCNTVNAIYDLGETPAYIVYNDPRNDLALLKISKRPETIAHFRAGRGVRPGEDILALGYPLQDMLSDNIKITKGMVNSLAGLNNDTRFLQISAPVQPGNSGGPLLDQAGNVVGVVTAKMDAVKMAKYTGDIPQNVNFALKASLVRDMLEVKDIDYETASSKEELKTVDIFDNAKKFTVLIECLQ